MVRYDPYTDSFIDNPTKETTATINLGAFPKNIIQMNVVEVSDESIEKIADAVVRKLADRKDEPNSSEIPNSCEDEPQRLEQFRVGLEYHTDTTHFGKTKGESVATNKIEDEPQTETEIAKAIVHKMIDDAVIAEDAYPDLRQKMHDAVDEYEPQTKDWQDWKDRMWAEAIVTEPTTEDCSTVPTGYNLTPVEDEQTDCTEALTLLWIKNMVTDEEFYRIDARLKVMPQTERSE